MPTTPRCPDRAEFQRLLTGQLADAEAAQLEDHLLTCPACAETVRQFQAADPLFIALRGQPQGEAQPDGASSDGLIERLLKDVPSGFVSGTGTGVIDTDSGHPRPSPERTQAVYDFLAPPGAPGELGRLGRYAVRKVLGVGGMGVVFAADDPDLGRPVALKVPRPSLGASASARRRFRAEARACAALAHGNVIPILHVGEDRGVPFLVLPLLRGETLDDRLRRDGRLPPGESLRVGRDVAAGLAAAHEKGLVHRDVKPSNVWLEADTGRAVILDFGLARLAGEAGETHTGTVIGTPAYLAPEQARGEPPNARADLFSLGCVLFRAATGRLPFQGADVLSTLRALEMEQPPAPRTLAPDTPTPLSDLILALLEKKPADRIGSAAEVRDALDAIRAGRSPRVRRRARRWGAAGLAAGVLAVGIAAAVVLALRGDPPPAGLPTGPPAGPPAGPPVVGLAGTFWPQVSYPVGKRPYTAVAGDLNGDGKPDLVASNEDDDTVSVLLNAGNGAFRPAVSYPTGAGPHGVVIGDFDRDGKPDLAVADRKDGTVSLLLGNGDGTFRPRTAFATAPGPRGLAVADLNGDGKLDLAVTSFLDTAGSHVAVYLGNGDGTFGPAHTYSVGGAPVSVAVADLNGDGKPDLVVSNGGSNTLSVFLGNGDGTFRAVATCGVGSGPGAVVVADFDRDGRPDLAVENVGSNDVSVLLGNGDGTFRPGGSYPAGAGPGGLAAADLNGDGLTDLVVSNHHSNNISVLIGKGDGTFRPPVHHAARWMPAGLAVADLDGDGRPDVAVVNYLSHDLSVLRGRPPSPYFRLAAMTQVRAGSLDSVSIFATDSKDTPDLSPGWQVRLSCTDARAELPATIRYGGGVGDTAVARVRFRTAGIHTLTVTDVADQTRLGTTTILVLPTETARFRVVAPERVAAGKTFVVAVTAVDEFDNPTPDYGGPVRFTCTDGGAVLPPEYRFADADDGVHSFEVTLTTPGPQTITVADPNRRDTNGRATVWVSGFWQ